MANNRASATLLVREYMPLGWFHEENDIERTSRDDSRDFNRYVRVTESLSRINQAHIQP